MDLIESFDLLHMDPKKLLLLIVSVPVITCFSIVLILCCRYRCHRNKVLKKRKDWEFQQIRKYNQRLEETRQKLYKKRKAPPYLKYIEKIVRGDKEIDVKENKTIELSPVTIDYFSSNLEFESQLNWNRVVEIYFCNYNRTCSECQRCSCRKNLGLHCQRCRNSCDECDHCNDHFLKLQEKQRCQMCKDQRERRPGYKKCSRHSNCFSCRDLNSGDKVCTSCRIDVEFCETCTKTSRCQTHSGCRKCEDLNSGDKLCSNCQRSCEDCDVCHHHSSFKRDVDSCRECTFQSNRTIGYKRCSSHKRCSTCRDKVKRDKYMYCSRCLGCQRCNYSPCGSDCYANVQAIIEDLENKRLFDIAKANRARRRAKMREQRQHRYRALVIPIRSAQEFQRKLLTEPASDTLFEIANRHLIVENKLLSLEIQQCQRICGFTNMKHKKIDFYNENQRLEVYLDAERLGLSLCEPITLPHLNDFPSFIESLRRLKNCRSCKKCNTCQFCPSCIFCPKCMFCNCTKRSGSPCGRCTRCSCYQKPLCDDCTACSSCSRCQDCIERKRVKQDRVGLYVNYQVKINKIRLQDQSDRLRCIRDLERRIRGKEQMKQLQEQGQGIATGMPCNDLEAPMMPGTTLNYSEIDEKLEYLENAQHYDPSALIKDTLSNM